MDTRPEGKRRGFSPLRIAAGVCFALLLALVAGVCVGEALRWRFLAGPVEQFASRALERRIDFGDAPEAARFRLQLFGSGAPRLDLAALTVANLPGESAPMIQARALSASLRYRDLLAFRPGQALRLQTLEADTLALRLVRGADGRANWQFGKKREPDAEPFIDGLRFTRLAVKDGTLDYRDAPLALDLDGKFGFEDSSDAAANTNANADAPRLAGLHATATGHYRGQPLKAELSSGPLLAAFAGKAPDAELALKLSASSGRSALTLDGKVNDVFGTPGFDTAFTLKGPSLAAVGKPLGVTLPVTAPFTMRGRLAYDARVWKADIANAHIGRSDLGGEFVFRQATAGQRAKLDGTLTGKALWLADLGPSIGASGAGAEDRPKLATPSGRVLPNREFDLPALRAMDADVDIALDRLELGTPALEDIRPLKARLLLQDGQLALEDLDARMARGHVRGRIALDGRNDPALWQTRLKLSGIQLEEWIRAAKGDGRVPYVSGRMAGEIELDGQGRSTAAILGSARGSIRLLMVQGSLSHLAVEVAGLDLAQALGVFVSGDNSLPVTCGVAALHVTDGMVRPELFLIDTRDSRIRVGGGASLATERLDLIARVSPKDFSPLSLRTPVRVRGTFAQPSVRVEAAPLLVRLGAAAALSALNPFAALLPLIDPGTDRGAQDAAVCGVLANAQSGLHKDVGQD